MVKRLRLQNFTNLDSAILPCPELDVDGIVRRILEPAQVGSDSDDDGPPTPEACNTDQARALTVLLSCSDEKKQFRHSCMFRFVYKARNANACGVVN